MSTALQYPSLCVTGFKIKDSNDDGYFKPFRVNDQPYDAIIYDITVQNNGNFPSPEGATVTFDQFEKLTPLDPPSFILPELSPGISIPFVYPEVYYYYIISIIFS